MEEKKKLPNQDTQYEPQPHSGEGGGTSVHKVNLNPSMNPATSGGEESPVETHTHSNKNLEGIDKKDEMGRSID